MIAIIGGFYIISRFSINFILSQVNWWLTVSLGFCLGSDCLAGSLTLDFCLVLVSGLTGGSSVTGRSSSSASVCHGSAASANLTIRFLLTVFVSGLYTR